MNNSDFNLNLTLTSIYTKLFYQIDIINRTTLIYMNKFGSIWPASFQKLVNLRENLTLFLHSEISHTFPITTITESAMKRKVSTIKESMWGNMQQGNLGGKRTQKQKRFNSFSSNSPYTLNFLINRYENVKKLYHDFSPCLRMKFRISF